MSTEIDTPDSKIAFEVITKTKEQRDRLLEVCKAHFSRKRIDFQDGKIILTIESSGREAILNALKQNGLSVTQLPES